MNIYLYYSNLPEHTFPVFFAHAKQSDGSQIITNATHTLTEHGQECIPDSLKSLQLSYRGQFISYSTQLEYDTFWGLSPPQTPPSPMKGNLDSPQKPEGSPSKGTINVSKKPGGCHCPQHCNLHCIGSFSLFPDGYVSKFKLNTIHTAQYELPTVSYDKIKIETKKKYLPQGAFSGATLNYILKSQEGPVKFDLFKMVLSGDQLPQLSPDFIEKIDKPKIPLKMKIDANGLDPDKINIIMSQANCTYEKAVIALKNNTYIVDSIQQSIPLKMKIDATGVDTDDIKTVMSQAHCTYNQAVIALKKTKNIIDAILELTP